MVIFKYENKLVYFTLVSHDMIKISSASLEAQVNIALIVCFTIAFLVNRKFALFFYQSFPSHDCQMRSH